PRLHRAGSRHPKIPAWHSRLRRPLFFAQNKSMFVTLTPRTRCAPLPLVGRGWGGGSAVPSQAARLLPRCITPLPDPPPQGGREQTEFADRADPLHLNLLTPRP